MDYSDTPVQTSDTPVQSRDTHVKSRDTHVKSRDTLTKSRDPPVLTSDTQTSAIAINASSGAPLTLPLPKKSRRRRRRRNRLSANENSAPRSAAPVTPDERWANRNSASQRVTQHQPAASDPTQMKSTPVYKGQSIHSSHLTQPPVPATNRNSAFPFGLDRCEFPGLYKPAFPDPRQDLNTTPIRVNNSGSGLSSPSLLQPCTKHFSGRPARPPNDLSYTRGWGSYQREAWNCIPAVSARPTSRHKGRNRSRPTRSCCLRTPSPATYRCGYWRYQPAPTSAIAQETSFSKAVAIARQTCFGRPSARHPTDTGVNRRTPPGINKIWK